MTTETIDMTAFDIDGTELKTAGLRPEGWYRAEIRKLTPRTIEYNDKETGEPKSFPIINVLLKLTHQADYNDQGEYQGTSELAFSANAFSDFGNGGGGLLRLKNAYKAIVGSLPSGNTNAMALAEELQGQSMWVRIFHSENSDTGDIREKVASTFRSLDYGPPASVTVRQ